MFEEDAREGQQLRLASRQPVSTGTQPRIQSIRQSLQPLPQVQFPERSFDALVADTAVEKGQVVADAGVEELHILRHYAGMAARIFQWQRAQLFPIPIDVSTRGAVEAEEQPAH